LTNIKTSYLDALKDRILVFDGAMGTSLQLMKLGPTEFGSPDLVGCNDVLVLNFPSAVEQVHRSFMKAGADVLETDTFRANRLTLADYHLEGIAEVTNDDYQNFLFGCAKRQDSCL